MGEVGKQRERERDKYRHLARHQPDYGSTNHGKHTLGYVAGLNPRFVIDFGCGRNEYVRELRRSGVDGLGIDFAMPGADLNWSMHATPLRSGIADVVVSFDALEHLLEPDVPRTLAEMRRVATADATMIFSIAYRPSKITVDGENLHPTVRPKEWWLARIAEVADIVDPDWIGRYILARSRK